MLIKKIGTENYTNNEDRFIFAISVHSLECWIMPFHLNKQKSRIKSCEKHLNRSLTKNGVAFSKDYDCYKKLAKPIKGRKLVSLVGSGDSLGFFLSSLPELPIAAQHDINI